MSCMYDRILAHGFTAPAWANPRLIDEFQNARRGLLELCQHATAWVIDPVCDYMFTQRGQAAWNFSRDFPNLLPLISLSFFEMQRQPYLITWPNGQPVHQSTHMDFYGWGVLIRATQIPSSEKASRAPSESVSASATSLPESIQGETQTPAWQIDAVAFVEQRRGQIVGPVVAWKFVLDATGAIAGKPTCGSIVRPHIAPGKKDAYRDWQWRQSALFFPVFLAISLLRRQEASIEVKLPAAALSHAFERRHGRPLTPFYQVVVKSHRPVAGMKADAPFPVVSSSSPIPGERSEADSPDHRFSIQYAEMGEEHSNSEELESGEALENSAVDLSAIEPTVELDVPADGCVREPHAK